MSAPVSPTHERAALPEGDLAPSHDELVAIYEEKFAPLEEVGWGPRMRLSFDYFTPDEYYEALLAKLVVPGCDWAEIGCGRDIFPSNRRLARRLSERAGYLLGIDPDANIHENPFLTESFQGMAEDYPGERRFDVVSMRMVAEHVEHPEQAMRNVARIMKPGGLLVLYTPHKWAVVSFAARAVPFWLHEPIKRVIWQTEPGDTFPVQYRMNTHKDLTRIFAAVGFEERLYSLLDDCRIFGKFRPLHWLELATRRVFEAVHVQYPEACVLAVYQKPAD